MEAKELTIDSVRKRLGDRGQKLTDEQISDILNMLKFICNKTIDGVIEDKIYEQ